MFCLPLSFLKLLNFYSVTDFLEKNLYDQRDVDNVKNNDLYVSQFIRKSETMADAADRLHEALKWRKETSIRGTVLY